MFCCFRFTIGENVRSENQVNNIIIAWTRKSRLTLLRFLFRHSFSTIFFSRFFLLDEFIMSPYHRCGAHAQSIRWIDGLKSYKWRLISVFFTIYELMNFPRVFSQFHDHDSLKDRKLSRRRMNEIWFTCEIIIGLMVSCSFMYTMQSSWFRNTECQYNRSTIFFSFISNSPTCRQWMRSGHGVTFACDTFVCFQPAWGSIKWTLVQSKLMLIVIRIGIAFELQWQVHFIEHCFRMDAKMWQNVLQLIFYGLIAPVNGVRSILLSLEKYDSCSKVKRVNNFGQKTVYVKHTS